MRRRIFQDPLWGETIPFKASSLEPTPQAELRPAPDARAGVWHRADTDSASHPQTTALNNQAEPSEQPNPFDLSNPSDVLGLSGLPETPETPNDHQAQSGATHIPDSADERWSELDGLPPLVTEPPPRPPRRPRSPHRPSGEPPRRFRQPRPGAARLALIAALIMIVFASLAALVYRFASHNPDYDAILAILNSDGKAASRKAKPPADPVPNFRWPCAGEISSLYGERVHPISGQRSVHTGIDIAAPYYEFVFAAADGEVTWAAKSGGKGNLVILKHNDAYESHYFHLQKIKVKKGERVSKGDLIAWVGSTGYSTGPHLHLEIHKRGEPVDPALYLPPPDEERLVRLKKEGVDYPMGGN